MQLSDKINSYCDLKVQKIIVVMYATVAVAKRKPEKKKFRLVRDSNALTSDDTSAAL